MGDKLARAVAKARIAEKLFARKQPVELGRYHLLEQVGAGGMGVVWGAWDPKLERRVAIKVVSSSIVVAPDRIVREGQALAKLSHPNIVPIYDVGQLDEQIYLVMEWIGGANLRAWIREPRTFEDIAQVYRACALGLAAAHAAGIVHRDFKPENAMLGDDGRVRVLDFGQGTTPRYAAPEGGELPAIDQYALGVALREACEADPDDRGPRRIPAWLAAICDRAAATDPAARFASMAELAAALGRDPRTVRRRRLAVAGAVGLAGATFAIGLRASARDDERCTGGASEIAAAWSPAARAAAIDHLRSLGPYGASIADSLVRALDAYARSWSATHDGACRASERRELTPALYAANLGCLVRAKASLSTVADVLATLPADRVPDAVVATSQLPDTSRCALEATSPLAPPPPAIADRVAALDEQLARARVRAFAIDPRALDTSRDLAAQAAALGYAPLRGRAELVAGTALLLQQKRLDAIAALDRAISAALEANDRVTAVEAIARRLYAVGSTTTLPADAAQAALAQLAITEPIAAGLPETGAFARALYYNNVGTLRLSRQDRAGARAAFERADRLRPPPSRATYELSLIPSNLALLEPDRATRDALFARAGDELATALGADHPTTLDARTIAAVFAEDDARSAQLLEPPCARFRAIHPALAEKVQQCSAEVVYLAEARGDRATARDYLSAIPDGDTAAGLVAGVYRAFLDGRDRDALARAELAFADLASAQHFFAKWRTVDVDVVAALAAKRLGDPSFRSHVDRGLATIAALGEFAANAFVERRRRRLAALSTGTY